MVIAIEHCTYPSDRPALHNLKRWFCIPIFTAKFEWVGPLVYFSAVFAQYAAQHHLNESSKSSDD